MEGLENIIHLNSVGSTNDYLKELSKLQFVGNLTCVYADFQESGKGQRGNSWISEKDENLLCSFLFKAKSLEAQNAFLINEWIAYSIFNVLNRLGLKKVQIKWPNDILVNKRKICGVLVENTLSGNSISESIIGIGLNVNSKPPISGATSLKIEVGQTFLVRDILRAISMEIRKNEELLTFRHTELKRLYLENLFGFSNEVNLGDNSGIWKGKVVNVLSNGTIEIENEGVVKEFQFKQIKWLDITS